jgi:hypothetical protein
VFRYQFLLAMCVYLFVCMCVHCMYVRMYACVYVCVCVSVIWLITGGGSKIDFGCKEI